VSERSTAKARSIDCTVLIRVPSYDTVPHHGTASPRPDLSRL